MTLARAPLPLEGTAFAVEEHATRTRTGEYRAIVAVNWSLLKTMIRGRRRDGSLVLSPLHFKAALDGVDVDTDAKRFGRAVHVATLEPDTMEARFCAYRESKSKGEGARKNWEAFKATETRTILTGEQYDRALTVAETVRGRIARNDAAAALFAFGQPEQIRGWVDKASGIVCKARLDWVHAPFVFLDLKTDGRTIEERSFAAAAERLAYFGQMAFYRRAQAQHVGCSREAVNAIVIPVESEPPHDLDVREVDLESLEAADEEIDTMLALLKQCRERDEWPSAYSGRNTLRRPAYTFGDLLGEEMTITTGDESHA